jgi:hypothetical protein
MFTSDDKTEKKKRKRQLKIFFEDGELTRKLLPQLL